MTKPLDHDSQDFVDDQLERANAVLRLAVEDAVRAGIDPRAIATAALRTAAGLDAYDAIASGTDGSALMAQRGRQYEGHLVAFIAQLVTEGSALAAVPPAGRA